MENGQVFTTDTSGEPYDGTADEIFRRNRPTLSTERHWSGYHSHVHTRAILPTPKRTQQEEYDA
jgi:hypothetical protein